MELWRWDVEYWGKAENLHMIDWYLDLNGRNVTDDRFKSMIFNEGIKFVAIDIEWYCNIYIYIYIYIYYWWQVTIELNTGLAKNKRYTMI